MNDRRKTLVAIAIIMGFVVLVVLAIGMLVSGGSIVSPVPHNLNGSAINIIFITPGVSPGTPLDNSTIPFSPTPMAR